MTLCENVGMRGTGKMPGRKHYATPRQIEVFANPLRADIFQRIAALGPATAPQIAESLSLPVTSLYHHLKALVAAGVVSQSNDAPRNKGQGRPAILYSANKRPMYLTKAMDVPSRRKHVAEIVRASARQAARDLGAALGDPATVFDGKRKNIAYFRSAFIATDANLVRINALLDELTQAALAPGNNRGQLLTITWFMSPPRRSKSKSA